MVRWISRTPAVTPAARYDAFPPNPTMMISNMLKELPPLPPRVEPATGLEHIEGFCVKCKASHAMVNPQWVTTKNGRSAARGKCQVCGTTMMKFLPAP